MGPHESEAGKTGWAGLEPVRNELFCMGNMKCGHRGHLSCITDKSLA